MFNLCFRVLSDDPLKSRVRRRNTSIGHVIKRYINRRHFDAETSQRINGASPLGTKNIIQQHNNITSITDELNSVFKHKIKKTQHSASTYINRAIKLYLTKLSNNTASTKRRYMHVLCALYFQYDPT